MHKSGDSRLTDFRRTRETTPPFFVLRPSFHSEQNFNIAGTREAASRDSVYSMDSFSAGGNFIPVSEIGENLRVSVMRRNIRNAIQRESPPFASAILSTSNFIERCNAYEALYVNTTSEKEVRYFIVMKCHSFHSINCNMHHIQLHKVNNFNFPITLTFI